MTDSILPDAVERRLAEILDGGEGDRAAAIEALADDHPDLAVRIRERFRSAEQILRDLAGIAPDDVGLIPETVGPFRVLELLGEGGMGTVYLAEQREPLQRRVAVKLIKPGMDSRRMLARFERERQVLSRMNHPGIARVLDAGMSRQGRPWFAVEYVRGVPLTDFCDRNQLDVRARLELFRQVCSAVQYAHHKGVIHRDLKPANVLVTDESGAAQAKIIDFGLARLADQSDGGATLHTLHGQVLGTPAYMSPEQVEMSGLDIDTRTDLYSLGVILYELLTGALPFDDEDLHRAGSAELQRRIREVDPPIPSSKATTSGDSSREIAVRRRTDLRGLVRQLEGDLDWITMKALEKDRSRRYQTAHDFSADLERYLNDEPVLATPPTVRYRVGKFLRRYRLQVTAAGLVLLTGLGWLVTSTWLYVEGRAARIEAQTRAEQARRVTDFVVDLFDSARVGRSLGEEVSVRDVLDDGARRVTRELTDQPEVRAELLRTLANVQASIGAYDKAVRLLEDAIETRTRIAGPRDLSAVQWRIELGSVLADGGHLVEAERQLRDVLPQTRAVASAELTARAKMELGNTLRRLGRLDDAGQNLRDALAICRAAEDVHPTIVAIALELLAAYLHDRGDDAAARPLFEESLERLEERFPRGSTRIVITLSAFSRCLIALGEMERAEQCVRRAVAEAERLYDEDDGRIAAILVDHAYFLRSAGRHVEAEPILRRSARIGEASLGPDDPRLAWILTDLGSLCVHLGRLEAGVDATLRAAAIYRAAYPGGHLHFAIALNQAANALAQTGRLDEAERLAQEALDMEAKLGLDGPVVAESLCQLALIANLRGDGERAERRGRESLARFSEIYPDGNVRVGFVLTLVGWALRQQGEKEEAEATLRRAITAYDRVAPDADVALAYPLTHLGLLLADERIEEALAPLARALDVRRRFLGAGEPLLVQSIELLGSAQIAAGRYAEAEPLLLEALEAREESAGADSEPAANVRRRLVQMYELWGKPDEARRHADRKRDGDK